MDDPISTLKRCTRCGELKPATTEFFFRSGNGLLCRCKICENWRKKEWLDTHPERARKNRHNQYIKHRDEVLEYSKNYQRIHRSDVNERARKRYQANPDKFRKIQQRYIAKNPQTWQETVRRYKQAHPDKI